MGKRISKAHIAATTGVLAMSVLGGTPAAAAATSEARPTQGEVQAQNWSSYMSRVLTGFQSRRWTDQWFAQVLFYDCTSYFNQSTHIQLREDIENYPDNELDTKKFTGCFGGGLSSGEWYDVPYGNYFFQVKRIDGQDYNSFLSVDKVYIDSSRADQN